MTAITLPKSAESAKLKSVSGPAFKKFEYAILDFETEKICRRPNYPPRPVSASLKLPGERKPTFYSWDHPEGNNCSKEQFGERLRDLWRGKLPVVTQHGKFDSEVAEVHFSLPELPWQRLHDTEYLLFLHDPHAPELALKESAQRILGIKPEERNRLREWILENVAEARRKPSEWGAYISLAPAQLVGPYANGDVYRTDRLFAHLLPKIHERGMRAAYDRERHLQPILLASERVGIRVNLSRLTRDFEKEVILGGERYMAYSAALEYADNWIRKRLKSPDLNIDADKDFGEVLAARDAVTQWTWTAGGKNKAPQRSVSKKNLQIPHFKDRKLALMYGYRNRLGTCLRMFMGPWIEMGRAAGGVLLPEWNQTRQDRNGGVVGARSGRPSCNDPNLLNISKDFEDKDDGYQHPAFLPSLPPLPLMRVYLLPDKGEVWGHRDYNQQELRMLAHYEAGGLAAHYQEKPYRDKNGKMRFDIHTTVQRGLIEIAMLELSRGGTKILNFSDIYGKGLANLAESLGLDIETTKRIRAAKNELMPGVPALISAVKERGAAGLPIRTWGGREYYAEPPKFVKKYNRVMDFTYKLVNYLVQPSSADVTKEAIIRHHEHPKREGRFLVTVYDEINCSFAPKRFDAEMRILREAMESIECDVPMLSDGKRGPSWGELNGYRGPAEREEWVVGEDKWWLPKEKSLALAAKSGG